MCGISGIFGKGWKAQELDAMILRQQHRGPDDHGRYLDPSGRAGLGQNRLSIIDLSSAGHQPMTSSDGRFWLTFNGEIYNYLELRAELPDYPYRSGTDTEVVLAAYERWGAGCLDRFVGMFAFLLWDTRQQRLFAARDRFGVKPLNFLTRPDGRLYAASEIKSLGAIFDLEPDAVAWASYLATGMSDYSQRTFWKDVHSLPAGHFLTWENDRVQISRWYDLVERVGTEFDQRPDEDVEDEYLATLKDSVKLRFRSDVPVGINLSGGLDSSTLLGLVHAVQGDRSEVSAFTFVTGDPGYDELPWVRQMLATTKHESHVCPLDPESVPSLAESVARHQDGPYGGLPTLAYSRIFDRARANGTIVLLDGQGIDEQWCGYDYYGKAARNGSAPAGVVQGTSNSPVRPECLRPEFRAQAERFVAPEPFPDAVRNLQLRDTFFTKIPRALRFNDRVSMRSSTELREPFLDHRLFEIAFRQPLERKIRDGQSKWMVRKLAKRLLPAGVVEAPKRPLQTPQREWLRGPLRPWADECIEKGLATFGQDWLDVRAVRVAWNQYLAGEGDNSFFVWQWVSLGMLASHMNLCPQ